MPFAVTRPGGGYYGLYGWVGAPGAALVFSRKEDAEQYIRDQRMIGALVERFEATTPGQPPKMAPFGLEKRSG